MESIPQFLEEKLIEEYGKDAYLKILEGYKTKRNTSIRVNSIKTSIDEIKSVLDKESLTYKEVSFYKDALVLDGEKEDIIRSLKIYEDGLIYMQSLSSMIPPLVMDLKENLDILDMTAAPGGKTTEIASIVQNNANITACEMDKIRCDRLRFNVEKQGARVLVMEKDSRNIDEFFKFDRILLDAPWHRRYDAPEETGHQERHLPLQRRTRCPVQPAAPVRLYPGRTDLQPGYGAGKGKRPVHLPHSGSCRPRLLRREPLRQVHGWLSRTLRHHMGRVHRYGTHQSRRQEREVLYVDLRHQHLSGSERRVETPRMGQPEDVCPHLEGLLPRREPRGLRHQRRALPLMGSHRVASSLREAFRQEPHEGPEQRADLACYLPSQRRGNLGDPHGPEEQAHRLYPLEVPRELAQEPGRPLACAVAAPPHQSQCADDRLLPPFRHL